MNREKNLLEAMAVKAKAATHQMAQAPTAQKNAALKHLASLLQHRQAEILAVNRQDIEAARQAGLSGSLIDRLSLQGRLEGIVADLQQVIHLPDPVGELFEQQPLPNQLHIAKWRTPLGVLGIIYEARPNVTIDVTALTLKSGNCALLRGGAETFHTNSLLVDLIQQALSASQLPKEAIQQVPSRDRQQIKHMLRLNDYIDLIIPRGGAALHQFCRANTSIPVVTGGIGICHLYVDESALLDRALEVVTNAKVQRPTVCNALDTLLVHENIATKFIPKLISHLHDLGVCFRIDQATWQLLENPQRLGCQLAGPSDWDTEWLSLTLGIKIVPNLPAALEHIVAHSSGHSDGILTETATHAERFIKEIDSAAVYVNASTRFTDGAQFGLGAEVAISTQKVHARGPMGLQALTSYKWIVKGNYAIRP